MSEDALAAASAAAAEAIQSGAADGTPPPPPAPAAEGAEGEPAPETFPRSYVEELRGEAAKYRTAAKPYEEAFGSLSETEREGYLALARDLDANPARALEGFERVVDNLRTRLGQPAADTQPQAQAAQGEQAELLTPEQVEARIEAKLAERDRASQQEQRVQSVFAEAQGISPAYAEGSDALVQLLHVAQNDPSAGGTLQGAHMVLMGKLAQLQEQTIQEYRDSLTPSGRRPVPGGVPTTGKPVEPVTTIEEATRRANEILNR
jgi:hypothetical protein